MAGGLESRCSKEDLHVDEKAKKKTEEQEESDMAGDQAKPGQRRQDFDQ